MTSFARTPRFLSLLVAAVIATASITAQSKPDSKRFKRIMERVVIYLRQLHLTDQKLDDTISKRAFDSLLESIDPLKLYLMSEDVSELRKSRMQFDDMLLAGNMSFAKSMWQRYIERLSERVSWVSEILKDTPDYTLEEQFVTDYDTANYAANEEDARERWRKRIKYDLLRLKADDVATKEAHERLTRRYASLERRLKQFDDEDILAMFITAISSGFDPHTTYMAPRTLENFEINMRLNYQGIGARLLDVDGYAEIESIIPGGAVSKQGGLESGDKIVAVAQGRDGDFEDTVGMRLTDVVKRIRGKEDTVVRLKISPVGGGKQRIVSIIRARTELVDQKAIGKVFDVNTESNKASAPAKIGVINLPSFYGNMGGGGTHRSAATDIGAILKDFKKQEVGTVVLDLRMNGGGLLSEAVDVTGLFINSGTVVKVRGFNGKIRKRSDRSNKTAWDGPLIVLTSKFSASASEIVAGAIKDYRRGIVVGDESTHGKGTVQQVLEIGRPLRRSDTPQKLGALKLTIQQFYRPGGLSTQRRGVRSDVVIPSITNEISEGEGKLPFAIPFDSIEGEDLRNYGMVSKAVNQKLASRSKARRSASAYFQQQQKRTKTYLGRKDKKSVTLNEAEFRAYLKAIAASDKETKKLTTETDKRTIQKDEFMDEVLSLAADYTALIPVRLPSKR
jgi:carboxyl-terminal processing protease